MSATTVSHQPSIAFPTYLTLVGAGGVGLLVASVFQLGTFQPLYLYLLLILLTAVSAFFITVQKMGDSSGGYTVGSIIGLAAVPTFGVLAVIPPLPTSQG